MFSGVLTRGSVPALVLLGVLVCPAARAHAVAPTPGNGGPPPLRVACLSQVVPWSACVFGLRATLPPASSSGDLVALPAPERGRARLWLPDTLETSWVAPDKKLHFLACYSIVLTGRTSSGETKSGIIAAAVLSVGKELWDLWFKSPPSHRGVSKRDLVADAAGIVAAVAVAEWFGE